MSANGEGIVIHGAGTQYAQNVYLVSNRIWDNTIGVVSGSAGPQSGTPDKVIIRNNLFYNNLSKGLQMSEDNGRDCDVSHNTFYSNGGMHIDIYGCTDDRFYNNFFVGSDTLMANSGMMRRYINDSLKNLRITDVSLANFVDPNNGNFHLQINSPAIDAATLLSVLWSNEGLITDIDAEERPAPGTNLVDYGADEFYNNSAPTAVAGIDLILSDNDGNGSEPASLDGSNSFDADGNIVNYLWTEGVNVLATTDTATLDFTIGTHTVILTVTDNDGLTGTDTVIITVDMTNNITSVSQNNNISVYPNPFTNNLSIKYNVNQNSQVKMELYNCIGILENNILNEQKQKGEYIINVPTRKLNTGIYVCKIQIGNNVITNKIIKK